jgi:hypothetical protein
LFSFEFFIWLINFEDIPNAMFEFAFNVKPKFIENIFDENLEFLAENRF